MATLELESPSTTNTPSRRRAKKAMIDSDPEDMETATPPNVVGSGATYNMDTDISKLEAPTFTTIDRGPPQPMMKLHWDHKVNLIGKKVVNPMIHCCDKCQKPILIYGRMIPCKHVFCLNCAKSQEAICSRCGDKVVRVEHAGLGSIYMCSHGGSRYGNDGCRRTYLSQRDLQAHIQHRHMKGVQQPPPSNLPSAAAIAAATAALVAHDSSRDNHGRTNHENEHHSRSDGRKARSRTEPYYSNTGSHISVISSTPRQSNLITIPIQDNGGGGDSANVTPDFNHFQQPPANPASNYGQYGQQGNYVSTFGQPPPNYYPSGAPPASSYPQAAGNYPPPQGQYQGAGDQQYSSQWARSAPSYYRR